MHGGLDNSAKHTNTWGVKWREVIKAAEHGSSVQGVRLNGRTCVNIEISGGDRHD